MDCDPLSDYQGAFVPYGGAGCADNKDLWLLPLPLEPDVIRRAGILCGDRYSLYSDAREIQEFRALFSGGGQSGIMCGAPELAESVSGVLPIAAAVWLSAI